MTGGACVTFLEDSSSGLGTSAVASCNAAATEAGTLVTPLRSSASAYLRVYDPTCCFVVVTLPTVLAGAQAIPCPS